MSELFDEMKLTGRLPSPAGVGMKILKLTQQDDYDVEDLVQVIRSDPALMGRIIKTANTAGKAGVEPITSIDEAVNRLGVKLIRSMSLGFSLISSYRDGACKGFDFEHFWTLALARAIACQQIATFQSRINPVDAYLIGLLADIGQLALACVYPQEYSEIVAESEGASRDELARREKERFFIDHSICGRIMLEDWRIPADLVTAGTMFLQNYQKIENLDDKTRDQVLNLRLADAIGRLVLADDPCAFFGLNEYRELSANIGLDEEELANLTDEIQTAWSEWSQLLELPRLSAVSITEMHLRLEKCPIKVAVTAEEEDTEPAEEATIATAIRVKHEDEDGIRTAKCPPLKVLAVDDDPIALKLLTHHIKSAGHEVIATTNGADALELALREAPEMIITDWRMPEMDGLELCRALRSYEFGRGIYLILCTGHNDDDDVIEAFNAGVDDYVTKPFSARALQARMGAGSRVVNLQRTIANKEAELHKHIREISRLNRKFSDMSYTDQLTGLPNRRCAMNRLNETWSRFTRHKTQPMSLIMIDIDHFKAVNDQFGHDAGDVVLMEVARVFSEQVRDDEAVFRLGGEEFLVVCPVATAEEALVCAERLRATLEATVIEHGEFSQAVTISLGVASTNCKEVLTSVDELLKLSDEAVYRAKNSGRNRVVVASEVPVHN